MGRSRKKIALMLAAWLIAGILIVQAISLESQPYTQIGGADFVAPITEDERALEIATALDGLREAGYSDGQGNRMEGGDWLRAKVRQRRQMRMGLYSGAGILLVFGLIVGMKARRPKPRIIFGVSDGAGDE